MEKVLKNFGKSGKVCHEAWVKILLKSGFEMEIFDPDCRIPKEIENHYIEILINIWNLKKGKKKGSLKGKYLGEYKVSDEWLNLDDNLKKHHLEGKCGVQTQDGIFLVKQKYLNDLSINVDDELDFIGIRYDLCAWHPIEE